MAELDGPRRRAIVYACYLADEVAIGGGGHAGFTTVPEIEDGADVLLLETELAHGLVLALETLPDELRRPTAERFYRERRRRGASRQNPSTPADEQLALRLGAAIALRVVPLTGRTDLQNERVLDLLQGAAQGDDLAVTPEAALAEARKAVARIRLDLDLANTTTVRGRAATVVAEALDPSGGRVDLQEVVMLAVAAAVGAWDARGVCDFLLELDALFGEAGGKPDERDIRF